MHSYPGLVAIVTVAHKGETNIMAAGWHSYISYTPPIYGVAIAEERYTHHLVKQEGKFAINFLPAAHAEAIQQAGVWTGSDGAKLDRIGLAYNLGENGAPILTDAYVAYECSTIDVNRYGDHDWFVASMDAFYRNQELFTKDGLPDFTKVTLPLYLGRSKYLHADQTSTIVDVTQEKHR
ncbi:flavin reductase [Paenalkalicoccus suaedae]|uniref:Flavin reductase n=2 Tax=Paenalkalicoccus suaedae TaxID=2592382 RepID=A0A859FK38_9BACI|nr:flavin reductase [Paenalkalicoccus suaedae]